jgi:hypothetical protein
MAIRANPKPSKFTAVIKIVEVSEIMYEDTSASWSNRNFETVSKDTELASIVVRASDLETLKSDIQAHVSLVKDMSYHGDAPAGT